MTDNAHVALVTGATSGIGLAIAQRLTQAGYRVALHSRASAESGLQAAATLTGARYFQADLLDEAARQVLMDEVIAHYGRLDVLVNNAGASSIIPHQDLRAATPEIWHRLYASNNFFTAMEDSHASDHYRDRHRKDTDTDYVGEVQMMRFLRR